jgi:hypothetical protein
MLRSIVVLSALVALVGRAPRACADEAMPAAPAAPGAPGAAPAAPPAPPAGAVVDGCGCCPAPTTCCPPRDRCRPGHLEIQAHASMLTPDPEGAVAVDVLADPARWDGLDYGIGIGGRVAWTNPLGDWDLRTAGTFWGLWSETTSDFGTLSSTTVPGGPPGTSGPFDVGLHSHALLWDLDVTLEKPWYCSPCFTSSWGFGLRYLRFDETAEFRFPDRGGSAVEGDVDNGLLAAEGVITGTWKLSSRWDLRGRASVFAGWMHKAGTLTFNNPPPGVATVTEGDDDDLGFGGELEIAARWHMNSCWSLSAGYGLLVLGNVTRGHESIDSANTVARGGPGIVFPNDTLLVHRVFLGLEFDL